MTPPSRPNAHENMPENAVEARNLCKTYAADGKDTAKKALIDVTMDIPRGSFFGLLGPNGAGKSTLINILAGLTNRTSGEVRIWDFDIDRDMRAARRAIGVVPQELNIDPFFTPREALELQAGLYGVPAAERRSDEILAAVGLTDQAGIYARRLSGGMRRRLLVAKAMVHSPKVLVLDEPTAGVDVDLRHHLWDYVRELNAQGATVLLTTHYLKEAEELCDTIAIINHGRLIACEDKKKLLGRLDTKEMVLTLDRDIEAPPPQLAAFTTVLKDARRIAVSYPPSRFNSGEILAALSDAGFAVRDVVTREAELEDIFLNLTRADNTGDGTPGSYKDDGAPGSEESAL